LTGTLAAFAVQVALALVWRVPHADELGSLIAAPLLVTLVYAFVSADAAETPVAENLVWERFLERAWAVIVIDFLLSDVFAAAMTYSTSANPLEMIAGIAAFIFSVLAVFSDAGAVVDDDVTVWTVIPRSLIRSVVTTWNVTIFIRALAIFSMWLLAFVAEEALYVTLAHFAVPQALFWGNIPINTLVTPPIAALTVVAYRDATNVLR
jgi:Ni,Fe-hydrogenase I cytochrome b subunit